MAKKSPKAHLKKHPAVSILGEVDIGHLSNYRPTHFRSLNTTPNSPQPLAQFQDTASHPPLPWREGLLAGLSSL